MIVSNNPLSYVPNEATAAAMLSGGMIQTMGTKAQILRDVVWPCLRGEQPRLPVSAGMGEVVFTNLKTGKVERVTLPRREGN